MKGHSEVSALIFNTREDAEKVINGMNTILTTYGTVSVGDIYELSGIVTSYKDNVYGWTDISSAKVVENKYGYEINIDSPRKFK